jgi:uncharacterized membrane protein YgdD (TMEM256/DUF423 family)
MAVVLRSIVSVPSANRLCGHIALFGLTLRSLAGFATVTKGQSMTSRQNSLLALAALSGLIAVWAGAFGAHGVTGPKAQEWLKTGAHYQLVHAVGALVALSLTRAGLERMQTVASLFIGGGLIFAGTLYAMALGGPRLLGAVTPIGGLGLMAGWGLLAWQAYRADLGRANP